MLRPDEEAAIHRGINEIFFNLRHLDVDDVAYHLVKFDPALADKLASAIEFNFFEKGLENERK